MLYFIFLVLYTWTDNMELERDSTSDYVIRINDVLRVKMPNNIIQNNAICNSDKGTIRLILFICSRITNTYERYILRKTWLSEYRGNQREVRYVFLLGRDRYGENQAALERESWKYGDLTQENFIDSYHNLTLKTIMGFKWASTKCANAEFVMKVDDDVFVNVRNLLRTIEKKADDLGTSVGGLCVGITIPSRTLTKYAYGYPFIPFKYDEIKKWDVPYEEYPNNTYPPYCSGTGYVTSARVAKDIYDFNRSGKLRYLRIEDVYIGMCIKHLGYKLTNIDGFAVVYNETLYKMDSIPNKCTAITVHPMTAKEIQRMWYSIEHRQCT